MLIKQHRLTSDFEYKVTKKYGKKYSTELFNLIVCKPLNYEGPAKIGFIISTTIDKRASKRNRVKRLFREFIRLNINKIPDNYWLIFYPKAISLNENYENISTQVNKVISEIFVTR